jgi:hypothetical protein
MPVAEKRNTLRQGYEQQQPLAVKVPLPLTNSLTVLDTNSESAEQRESSEKAVPGRDHSG